MSRKPRDEFKGVIYHVFQRGNNKEYIFKNDIEKEYENIKEIFPDSSLTYNQKEYIETTLFTRKTMDEILNDLNLVSEDINLIKSGSKKRYLTDIKLSL